MGDNAEDLKSILKRLQNKEITIDQASELLSSNLSLLVAEDAVLDIYRKGMTGIPEVILAEPKTVEGFISIAKALVERTNQAICTRMSKQQAVAIDKMIETENYDLMMGKFRKNCIVRSKQYETEYLNSKILILTAGTSDLPVAEETRISLEGFGCHSTLFSDIGVAGLHRLFKPLKEARSDQYCCIIVIAGMDGALPSVVTGLTDLPVIAVPTSIGYGVALSGISALTSMLLACSPGSTVVNIDSGFNAAASAYRIALQISKKKNSSD